MFKTIQVGLVLHTGQFGHGLRSAAGDVRQFGREVGQVATRTDQAARQTVRSAGLVSAAAGTTLAAALALSTRQAMAFERELRNVNSISRMSEQQLASTGRAVLDLSRTLPQSSTTLARGLYDIASSGFQGAQGLHILRTAAVGASAGLTDTATAAKGITAVLNAYGLSAGRAADVNDILFQSVNLGVLTYEEATSTLGDYVGMAAAAGVAFDEAAAAQATMTLAGINASEAATSLNRVLQAFIDPSEAMAQHLRTMGHDSGTAAIEALGLRGAVELVRTSTDGTIETFTRFFPEIRAARGFLALTSAEGENYARVAGEIEDENKRAGAAQAAFNEQAKSASFQLEIAKNSVGAAAIEIGGHLLPAVTSTAKFVTDLATGFGDLPGPVKTAMVATAGLGAVVLTTGGAFLLLAPRIVATRALMQDLAVTAPRTATAIGLVGRTAGVVGAVMTVATVAMAVYSSGKAEAKRVTDEFAQALTAEREGLEGASAAAITNELVKKNLVSTAQRLGVDIADLVGTIKGEEEARRRVNAQLSRYNDLVERSHDPESINRDRLTDPVGHEKRMETARDVETLRGAYDVLGDSQVDAARKDKQLRDAQEATGRSTKNTTGAAAEQERIMAELQTRLGGAEGATRGLTDAQRELLSAVQGFIDPSSILSDVESEKEQRRKRATKTTESAVKKELELESAVLGVARAERQLVQAAEELARVRNRSDVDDIATAERAFADAVYSSEDALRRAHEAQEALDRLRAGPDALSVEKAELQARQAEINAKRAREEADAIEVRIGELRDWRATEEELAPALREHEELLIRAREAEIASTEAQERLNDVRDGASPEELADGERTLADAQRAAAGAAADVATRQRELDELRATDRADELVDAELAYREALLGVRQAHEAVAEAQRKTSESTDEFDGAVKRSQATLAEFEQGLRDQIAAQLDWERNLVAIARRGGTDVAMEFMRLGRDHAGIVAQMADATDTEFSRMAELMKTKAEMGTAAHGLALEQGMKFATEIGRFGAFATAEAIAFELNTSVDTVKKIAEQYGVVLAEGIKPILKEVGPGQFRTYVPGKGFTGPVMMAQGGILNAANTENHVAQVAPAGAMRLWAEPETGGEAYIPLSPGKRGRSVDILERVARMFGYSLAEYASGGFASVADIPLPPRFEQFGRNLSTYASGFTQHGYEAAADVVRTARPGTATTGTGALGSGWRAITGYLDARSVPYTVTSTTGGRHVPGSLHYAGKAVDLVGQMQRIFDTLTAVRAGLAELFYTPAGYSIKNSAIVRPPIAAAGHYDHVHAATYDDGGMLQPGLTLAYNGTGRPEPVGAAMRGFSVTGPLCTVTVHTDARVDERAMKAAVREAVEPALRVLVDELDREMQGD